MPIHLEIHDQPRLGFLRTLAITWTGIRYRLLRAFMTLLVIMVAIAFLANMVVGSLLRQSVVERARAETQRLRLASFWISRLTFPATSAELIDELAGSALNDRSYREIRGFSPGKPSDADMREFREQAKTAQGYLDWLKRLKYAERRELLGGLEGVAALDHLQDAEARREFWAKLRKRRGLRPPARQEVFEAFLKGWPGLRGRFEQVATRRAEAVHRVNEYLGDRTALEALAPLDGGLIEVIRSSGFVISQEDTGVIAGQARDILLANRVEKALQEPLLKQRLTGYLDAPPGAITPRLVWAGLRKAEAAEWFTKQLTELKLPAEDLDAPTLVRLAEQRAYLDSLAVTLRDSADAGGGLLGLGERLTYLLGISLLVCAVGITNAMLMSVTERYREIATLKCLGALDSSILSIFILEACLLGFTGSLGGAILGAGLGFLRMWGSFGGLLFGQFPLGAVLLSSALVMITGVLLAALASVYPSLKAASLAPMETMRIE